MERFFRPLRVWEETNWSQSRRRPSQLRSRVCCGHQPSSLQQNYFIAILLIDALIYNYMHKKSRDITALLWCVILSYRIYLNCLPPGQLQSGPHLSKEGHPNVSEPFIQGRKELRIINNCYVQKYQYYCINIKCLLLLTYQTGKMNKKKYFTCSMLILRRGSGVPSLPPVDPLLPPPATSPPTTPPDMSYHYLYQPKPNILKERVNEALTRLGEYNI